MATRIFSLGVGRTFTALKYPNFRLWFSGQVISLFGTWMQTTAQGFLVYELTKSPAYLGYVGFAAGIPSWIFMLLGGVASDRFKRRNLLIAAQSSMMILAFILAALTFYKLVQPWHIIVLAFFLGIANAFDAPARLAFAPEMVEKEDLTNAIALNAMMFNLGAIVGPAAAGLVYALAGPGWCFTINGISFLAVILALMRMHLNGDAPPIPMRSAFAEIREGIRYVITDRVVRNLISLVGITSMFGISFVTLLPAWAVNILGGDVTTNGWLNSFRGLGAVIGALFIASLGRFKYRGRVLTAGTFLFPLLIIIFSLIRSIPLSLISLCGVGAAIVITLNMTNSIVQTTVPDHIRGRVMSIYSMIFFGMNPIGALLLGQAAAVISEPAALLTGAVILTLSAILFWFFAPFIRKLE